MSTLKRPVLFLDVSALQWDVLHLDVSTPQRPELHLDLSTLQRPALLLDVFTLQSTEALAASGLVYATEASAAHGRVYTTRGRRCIWTSLNYKVQLLEVSTLQGPELSLDLFTLQWLVLVLDSVREIGSSITRNIYFEILLSVR